MSNYEFAIFAKNLNKTYNKKKSKPIEALNCYLRTNMDVLVLENFVIKRKK